MITAKKMGMKKGDFVFTGMFPGIIIGEVHTATPCLEVWGVEHEMGSAYAEDLSPIARQRFIEMATQYGFDGTAYNKIAKKALAAPSIA